MSFKKLVCLVMIMLLWPMAITSWAADKRVVTLGANLSASQREKMLDTFGITPEDEDVEMITVTNAEERAYLEGIAPLKQIGSIAISCAYVQILDEGSGVNVKTKNITWVTKEAYANVLVTAGVKDAEVYAAAPFPVSGTAALTGLFKAYEKATGKEMPEEAKKVAAEELVTTGELGEQVGDKDKVSQLIGEVKQRVVEEGLKSSEDIRKVVLDVAAKLDINLTEEQIQKIVSLMQRIQGLDINIESLKNQLKNFQAQIAKALQSEQAKGWWEQVKQFFIGLWNQVKGWF